MLKIFVLLPCFNNRFSAGYFNFGNDIPVAKTKVNLNHYEVKFSLNNRLKSQIQMDKRKLVNIIIKDLEEIKTLSEEVADSQEDSSLVIDLALNRARLLVQEIELLRELAGNSVSMLEETDKDSFDGEDDEVSDISFSDPELEILHFEEREFPETEEAPEEEEEEIVEEDFAEKELVEDDDLNEEDEIDQDEDEQENAEEELEEEDLTETEDEDNEEEEIDEDELEEETEPEVEEEKGVEEPLQKTNIQHTELKNGPQPGIREIHIDDLDDDEDLEPVQFSPYPGSSVKPPMREIPKPENTAPEKMVIGETFQKERSLNDSIGEYKSESKLTNGPITSLRAAIGLNDRFIFIREIFDNNTEKYNTVIEKLDKMEHIQEAVEFLKANLSMQKNEASMKFVELLKRRFTK
jgi:hypothetical protein